LSPEHALLASIQQVLCRQARGKLGQIGSPLLDPNRRALLEDPAPLSCEDGPGCEPDGVVVLSLYIIQTVRD
jgi:hypothetical protein